MEGNHTASLLNEKNSSNQTNLLPSANGNKRRILLLVSSLTLVVVSCILLSSTKINNQSSPPKRKLQTTNNQYFWYFHSAVTRFSGLTLDEDTSIDDDEIIFSTKEKKEVKQPKSIKVIETKTYEFKKSEDLQQPNMYALTNIFEDTESSTPYPTPYPTPNPTMDPTPNPTINPTSNPTSNPTINPIQKFVIYVMGDIPYSDLEKEQLKTQLSDLPYDGDFIVHVGDIFKTSRSTCTEQDYTDVRDILINYSAIPVFMLPGDNDWKDCPEPARSLNTWFEHFEAIEQNWSPLAFKVNRERKEYRKDDESDEMVQYQSEYFSFVHKNVLFVGVHIIGAPIFDQKEWEGRHEVMLQWTAQNIATYSNDVLHAIVIFGHAGPDKALKNDDYFDPLVQIHEDYISSIPIVYIHGNGHRYRLYKPFDSETMTALQVDQGAIASPLRITIDPTNGASIDQYSFQSSKPGVETFMNFEFDRRLE